MILKYCDMFLKLKDLCDSPTFKEVDMNNDGSVFPKDFKAQLEKSKKYTNEEVSFLMSCNSETNHEGKIDYIEFCESYYDPAKSIGFNLAVLFTNLSEHMPNDVRLAKFLETAGTVLNYFESFLGRIEIKTAEKVERVYFEIDEDKLDQWEKPQIKESKKAFFYATISDGGDKEKMECFVNFCEDAIFEMQHSASLMETEDGEGTIVRRKGPTMPKEDEPRGIIAPLKENIALVALALSPSSIMKQITKMKAMSPPELIIYLLTTAFWITCFFGSCALSILGFLLTLMRGSFGQEEKSAKELELVNSKKKRGDGKSESPESSGETEKDDAQRKKSVLEEGRRSGVQLGEEERKISLFIPTQELTLHSAKSPDQHEEKDKAELAAQQEAAMKIAEKKAKTKPEGSPLANIDLGSYGRKIIGFLTRNFFNMKNVALVIAFLINIMLLFYRASPVASQDNEEGEDEEAEEDAAGDDDDEDIEEWIHVEPDYVYVEHVISVLAIIHALLSFFMVIAYYNLKVPLGIFIREKEVGRRLEFEGLYIKEKPEDDDMKAHWDSIVISAKSFPCLYWDKFIKKRVRQKFSEEFDFDQISNILGMEKSAVVPKENPEEKNGLMSSVLDVDWRYQVWKIGVTFTDSSFLYLLFYFLFSVLGNYNYFFFAPHLLDVAVVVPSLKIILQAITYNGKELCLTVGLLTIVCYLYSVIAFNFFRKFYVSEEEEGQPDAKCHDMLTCFVFHFYKGVRAGGGIGDEIEPPDGDDLQYYRIVFDFSFYLFITLILLAIIQGFIIDAFGALRDQMDGVQEELENNCFICGIGKDYFDKVPHGFETHVEKEHNLAHYLFFLQYLIEKDENDYTGQVTNQSTLSGHMTPQYSLPIGQETLVWDMYQSRTWDFFPQGDCFRKQYEAELGGGT